MGKRKDFFYNPQFRMSCYLSAWMFLGPVLLLAIIIPRLDTIISRYRDGDDGVPALIIGLVGAFVLETAFLFVGPFQLGWELRKVFLVIALYVAGTCLSWLALSKMMYYEQEEP